MTISTNGIDDLQKPGEFVDIRAAMRGCALWITLARAETYNALSLSALQQINDALSQFSDDPELRCVVITGTGPAFCVGANLSELLSQSQSEAAKSLRHFVRTASTLFDRIEALPIPTVAALNGLTLAGGLELALCCDVIFASETAKVGDAHAKYGQIPGGGATVRLPRRIGPSRAKYLMFSGAHLSAEKALAWGLVDEVVPASELSTTVTKFTQSVGERSSLVLSRMKILTQRQGFAEAREGLEAELLESSVHFESYDQREGLLAFSEKRPPKYLGR